MMTRRMTEAEDGKESVEEIMQQIQVHVAARGRAVRPEGASPEHLRGQRFSSEYYEHLYQARVAYEQLKAAPALDRSPVRGVGYLREKIRHRVHELVLFYLDQFTARQIEVDDHLWQALGSLSNALDQLSEESADDE